MAIKLFVGDNNVELAEAAKKFDSSAFLIDHYNYKKFLSNKYGNNFTAYTSISDLPKITTERSVFFEVLCQADQIFYCPPDTWNDKSLEFNWDCQQTQTEYYLYNINSFRNNVSNLDLSRFANSKYLNLVTQRSQSEPALWIAGCSFSHGVGVDQSQRYGQLIAQKICRPVYHLTKGASSIEWAADQILRSNIQVGDIVIWGLTSDNRTVTVVDDQICHETDPDLLLDEIRLYHAVTKIYQVENFCKKIQAKLLLLPIVCSAHLRLLCHSLESYVNFPYMQKFVDLGTDGVHPGPQQHQLWAKICLDKLYNIQ